MKHIGGHHARQDLLHYVTAVRSFLRMDNWDVIIMKDPSEDDGDEYPIQASVDASDNHATMNIWVGKDWGNIPAIQKETCIVHEMIHMQHRDVTILWDACVRHNTSFSVDNARDWSHEFQMHMERFVSWITRELMVRPDLPRWSNVPSVVGTGVYLQGENP